MATFALDRRSQSFAEINVTPLVDVMLVLLIIFMIAAPLVTHKLSLNFGSNSCPASGCPKPADPVDLSIKQTGELYWNGVALNRAQLEHNFTALAPSASLTLHPESRTRYEAVAEVLAMAKNADIARIVIEPR